MIPPCPFPFWSTPPPVNPLLFAMEGCFFHLQAAHCTCLCVLELYPLLLQLLPYWNHLLLLTPVSAHGNLTQNFATARTSVMRDVGTEVLLSQEKAGVMIHLSSLCWEAARAQQLL